MIRSVYTETPDHNIIQHIHLTKYIRLHSSCVPGVFSVFCTVLTEDVMCEKMLPNDR